MESVWHVLLSANHVILRVQEIAMPENAKKDMSCSQGQQIAHCASEDAQRAQHPTLPRV